MSPILKITVESITPLNLYSKHSLIRMTKSSASFRSPFSGLESNSSILKYSSCIYLTTKLSSLINPKTFFILNNVMSARAYLRGSVIPFNFSSNAYTISFLIF